MHLYNEIIKLRPDWHDPDPEKGAIKIVMTGSASDKALLRPHIYDGKVKKRLEKRFKDPADSLRLVIVRDMWLTLPEHRPVAHQRVLDAEPNRPLKKSPADAGLGQYDLKRLANDADEDDERQPRLPGGDVQLHQP